jgi:hypothetical protein
VSLAEARPDAAHVSSRVPRAVTAAVLLPAAAATAAVALFVLLDAAGATLFSDDPPLNIAEAAGMGSGPEVLRLLREGQDPTEVLPVRPYIISSNITRVTAVEAAVWGRRVQLLRLLEREGAFGGSEARQYVACLATIARVPSIVDEFAPSGVVACDVDEIIQRLKARSP